MKNVLCAAVVAVALVVPGAAVAAQAANGATDTGYAEADAGAYGVTPAVDATKAYCLADAGTLGVAEPVVACE